VCKLGYKKNGFTAGFNAWKNFGLFLVSLVCMKSPSSQMGHAHGRLNPSRRSVP
jgi:hypothetical protein